MPPLVVFGGISAAAWFERYPQLRRVGLSAACVMFAWTATEMVRLHPNQYVYFNTLVSGGVENAAHRYGTDYWENSLKQGVPWVESHMPPAANKKITIGGFSENIQYMIDAKRAFQQALARDPKNAEAQKYLQSLQRKK